MFAGACAVTLEPNILETVCAAEFSAIIMRQKLKEELEFEICLICWYTPVFLARCRVDDTVNRMTKKFILMKELILSSCSVPI